MVDVSGKPRHRPRGGRARPRVHAPRHARGCCAAGADAQGRRARHRPPRRRAWPPSAPARSIPLAHPLPIEGVELAFTLDEPAAPPRSAIEARVRTRGPHRRRDGGAHRGDGRRAHALRHAQGGGSRHGDRRVRAVGEARRSEWRLPPSRREHARRYAEARARVLGRRPSRSPPERVPLAEARRPRAARARSSRRTRCRRSATRRWTASPCARRSRRARPRLPVTLPVVEPSPPARVAVARARRRRGDAHHDRRACCPTARTPSCRSRTASSGAATRRARARRAPAAPRRERPRGGRRPRRGRDRARGRAASSRRTTSRCSRRSASRDVEVGRAPARGGGLDRRRAARRRTQPLPPGAIRDSNLPDAGRAARASAGARVVVGERVPDDPGRVARRDRATRSRPRDVVLTIGGVSAGDFDPVKLSARRSSTASSCGAWR